MAAELEELERKLLDRATPMPVRFRALFALRGLGGDAVRAAFADGLKDPSALLRHEIAFCLGQMQDAKSVDILIALLEDAGEHPMVRHEAAEALGAIATPRCLHPLREHQHDVVQEVRETCRLALRRVEDLASKQAAEGEVRSEAATAEGSAAAGSAKERMSAQVASDHVSAATGATEEARSPYLSVDPAPAMSEALPTTQLRALLLDEQLDMFQRYAALFSLRNKGGPEEVEAMTAAFQSSSALLKHEVAYVLGQVQSAAAVDKLAAVLQDEAENPMVRHEAAEALGSIADSRCTDLLRQYVGHSEPILADSCVVALDIMDYEQSGAFGYCDGDAAPATVAAH